MRITLQTLLTLVVVALVAVAKRNSFHLPQDAALADARLMNPFDGGYWGAYVKFLLFINLLP